MTKLVKIKRPVYIRKGPGASFDFVGVIYPSGRDILVDGEVTGETLKGISEWCHKTNDKGEKLFFWNGVAVEVDTRISWGIRSLGIDQVWPSTLGERIKVAILDTGIDLDNDDLKSAVVGGFNILTNENFQDNNRCIQDTDGHGTACATVVASRGRKDIIGIAPACNLIVIKTAENKNQLDLQVTLPRAINKAIELGADIVSISSGFFPDDQRVITAIQQHWDRHLFVAAAGNERSFVAFPANNPGMISVGAIQVDNTELGFRQGNYDIGLFTAQGPKNDTNEGITIVAPGDKIPVYGLGGIKTFFRGTSSAAPYVSGVLALLLSQRRKMGNNASAQKEVREKLINTAFQAVSNADVELWGSGIIDPVKLILG